MAAAGIGGRGAQQWERVEAPSDRDGEKKKMRGIFFVFYKKEVEKKGD